MQPIEIGSKDYTKRLKYFLARDEVKAYTMAILSLFAVSFFSLFAIKPTLTSFFNLRRQIEDSKNVNEKLEQKINTLLKAQENYQRNQEDLALLEEALPPEPHFTELIRRVETLVYDNNATITAFTAEEFSLLQDDSIDPNSDLTSVTFELDVASDYPTNQSIVQKFMNLRRIIGLTGLNFFESKRAKTSDSDSTVGLSIDAEAYYLSTTNGGKKQ